MELNREKKNCSLSKITQKDNKTFLILSVLGILFVVLGHSKPINIFLNNVFPYYSFHMPLFAFISGYFFKDRTVVQFLNKKFKKLIIPYFAWNFIYGIIINILKYLKIINYGKNFTLFNILVAPFYGNSNQFSFNVAAWFVITIFFIQVIYLFIYKFSKKIKVNIEIPLMLISCIIAYYELKMVKEGYNYGCYYLLTRICFLFPFYLFGQIYKKYEKFDKLYNAVYFGIIIIIQSILLQKFNIKYNLNTLLFRDNYIVYFIGSMTGILFWLRISKIVSPYIGQNKIINYIGNNTYSIMMHHMFCFFLINSGIYIINNLTGLFAKFDIATYKRKLFYYYNLNPGYTLIYVCVGVAVPLIGKYVFDMLKNKYIHFEMEKIKEKFIKKRRGIT